MFLILAVIVWTYNGGRLPTNSQILLPENGVSQLQLSVVKQDNAGVYACLAHLGPSRNAVTVQLEIYGQCGRMLLSVIAYI